ARVVTAVAIVPTAPIVPPAAAPVGVAGVDRDPALDVVAVALAVDRANISNLSPAPPRIAARIALGSVDALLYCLARVARTAVAAVIAVVAIPVVARSRCDRGDSADDQRSGDYVACIDSPVAIAPLRLRRSGGTDRHRTSRD